MSTTSPANKPAPRNEKSVLVFRVYTVSEMKMAAVSMRAYGPHAHPHHGVSFDSPQRASSIIKITSAT